jgi:hypothetical protein
LTQALTVGDAGPYRNAADEIKKRPCFLLGVLGVLGGSLKSQIVLL